MMRAVSPISWVFLFAGCGVLGGLLLQADVATPIIVLSIVIAAALFFVAQFAGGAGQGGSSAGLGQVYRDALDHLDDSVAVEKRGVDDRAPGRILYPNKNFVSMFAIEEDPSTLDVVRLISARFEELDGSSVASETLYELAALATSGKTQQRDLRKSGPDAAVYRLKISGAGSGQVLWSLEDISEEQKRLARQEERLVLLTRALEQAPFGLLLLNNEFGVLEANASFRALVGDEDLVGKKFTALFETNDSESIKDFLRYTMDEPGGAAPLDLEPAGRRGTTVTIHAVQAAPRGTESRGSVLIHAVDATERRRLEQQFAQSQKMQALGQLAGGVAHDFNNMLTAIMGFSDLVLQRHHQGEETFADVMQITQNAKRAARLVRQLLAFSRQQPLQPKLMNITDVLADITSLMRRVLGDNVKLSLNHGQELGLVRADQSQLEQIVINLAVNARDAMETNGELRIETGMQDVANATLLGGEPAPMGAYVTIRISDTGTGIQADIIDKIFDPFFTTKEIGAGTGLGLSMVYGSMKQMNGFVSVESNTDPSKGETGTTFTLYMPQAAPHGADVEEEKSTSGSSDDVTGGGEILLVEDEDPVRMFSARALRNKGYVVTEARTGTAAVEILNEQKFDLMITDMMMPEMDGATLIHHARNMVPDLRIICISGYTQETAAKEVMELPQVYFLAKPFSLKQLAAKVKIAISSD